MKREASTSVVTLLGNVRQNPKRQMPLCPVFGVRIFNLGDRLIISAALPSLRKIREAGAVPARGREAAGGAFT